MTRALFLSRLKDGLSGMPEDEIRDIVADYEAHFAEAMRRGAATPMSKRGWAIPPAWPRNCAPKPD